MKEEQTGYVILEPDWCTTSSTCKSVFRSIRSDESQRAITALGCTQIHLLRVV